MKRAPTHRNEHTGEAGRDRPQENVRELVTQVKQFIARIERQHGIGVRRIAMRNETYRMTTEDFIASVWIFDSVLTSQQDVVIPDATDATGYERWVENQTGQTLRFVNKSGDETLAAVSGTMKLVVSSDGPTGYT